MQKPEKAEFISYAKRIGIDIDPEKLFMMYEGRGWRPLSGGEQDAPETWQELLDRYRAAQPDKAPKVIQYSPRSTRPRNGFTVFEGREDDLDAEFLEEYKARYKKWAEENPRENDPYIVAIERGWTQEQKVKAIREQEELLKQGLKWSPPEE